MSERQDEVIPDQPALDFGNLGLDIDLSWKGIITSSAKAGASIIHSELMKRKNNIRQQTIPVYKVMITRPGKNGKAYRSIIADTSRPGWKNFYGLSGSPIIGLWVDQSDMTEPDKVIILMENPSSTETGILEQDWTKFTQFGVRNWLDVWIGYKPVATQHLSEITDRLGKRVLPDDFLFGNETHVFSGPVVSIKRDVSSAGDRLQIIGFSPIMILKQMEAQDYRANSIEELMTMKEFIEKIQDDIITMREYEFMYSRADESVWDNALAWKFLTGDFFMYMMSGGGTKFKVIPIDTPERGDVDACTEQYLKKDQDSVLKILEDTFINRIVKGKTTVYDLLFSDVVEAAYTRRVGMYAFIDYQKTKETDWAYKDGYGHPGVAVRYGYKHEISNIRAKTQGIGTGTPSYGSMFQQRLILGLDAREFEAGIEYGSVFNVGKFMAKPSADTKSHKLLLCPLNKFFFNLVTGSGNSYQKESKLWEYIMNDIRMYGPTYNPMRRWLYGKDGNYIDLKEQEVADYIARSMREFYFAGMTGSVFAVGNPSMKPGRVLEITDQRKILGFPRADRVADLASKARRTLYEKVAKVDPYEGVPIFTMKDIEKRFYIWKIRHYFGATSGYITKVYFTETRHRGWQRHVSSISTLITQALQQFKQVRGNE